MSSIVFSFLSFSSVRSQRFSHKFPKSILRQELFSHEMKFILSSAISLIIFKIFIENVTCNLAYGELYPKPEAKFGYVGVTVHRENEDN
jgi:hypothetical protein